MDNLHGRNTLRDHVITVPSYNLSKEDAKMKERMSGKILPAVLLIIVLVMLLTSCIDKNGISGDRDTNIGETHTEDTATAEPELSDIATQGAESETKAPETEHIHDVVKVPALAATCERGGYDSYDICRTCSATLTEKRVISAPGHNEVKVPGYKATCNSTGLTDYSYCDVCGKTLKQAKVIPEKHDFGTRLLTKCRFSYQSKRLLCNICNRYIEVDKDSLPEHNIVDWPGEPATCSTPRITDGQHCSNCGYTTYSRRETTEFLPHSFVDGKCKDCGLPKEATPGVLYKIVDNQYAAAYKITKNVYGTLVIASEYKGYPVREVFGLTSKYEPEIYKEITKVILPEGLTKIGFSAFYRMSGLVNITIPTTVTEISSSAFAGCVSLRELYIPEGVTKIGGEAFSDMVSLKSISIPSTLTELGFYAFKGCQSLSSVKLPDKIKSLEMGMFSECFSLKEVKLPSGLEVIHSNAFSRCKSLFSVEIPDSCKTIQDGAFSESLILRIHIPANVEDISQNAFSGCDYIRELTIDTANKKYTAKNGCIIKKDDKSLFIAIGTAEDFAIPNDGSVIRITKNAFQTSTSVASIEIPSTIIEIEDGAFAEITNLKHLTIKSGELKLSSFQFADCKNLLTVVIEDEIEKIPPGCFSGCESLTDITIPASVKIIGESAFEGCSSLERISIPDGVSNIGFYAFKGCKSLKEINIPGSVTEIGSKIFEYCSSLTQINFGGSTEDWKKIYKTPGWDDECKFTVKCTDGEIAE